MGGFNFGLSSSLNPIPDNRYWAPSAMMFTTQSVYRGWINQPNDVNSGLRNKYNFLSMPTPWRDGDRAGVSINIETNEIDWYYKGKVIWTSKDTKKECNFEIGDKHHPTVTMYYTGMQAKVHFDGPFENF